MPLVTSSMRIEEAMLVIMLQCFRKKLGGRAGESPPGNCLMHGYGNRTGSAPANGAGGNRPVHGFTTLNHLQLRRP